MKFTENEIEGVVIS